MGFVSTYGKGAGWVNNFFWSKCGMGDLDIARRWVALGNTGVLSLKISWKAARLYQTDMGMGREHTVEWWRTLFT